MSLEFIKTLPMKVAKLPEVGDGMQYTANQLALKAAYLERAMLELENEKDDFVAEIQELWTRKERKESGL